MWEWFKSVREWFGALAPSDWIALVGTTATVIALAIAAWQLHLAAKAHKLNQRAQQESLRPYVAAQLLPPRSAADSGRIGVKNFGKMAAHNVSVTFDPPLPRLSKEEIRRNSPKNLEIVVPAVELLDKVFGSPIRTIVPDQQIECTYWHNRKRYDGFLAYKVFEKTPEEDAADQEREARERAEFDKANSGLSAEGFSADTEAVITYNDDNGVEYSDRFGLDPAVLQGFTFINTETTSTK